MNKNIITKILIGTIVLATISCKKREAIHQITNTSKYPIIERIDSFAKSSSNKTDTTNLEKFAVDTLEISNKKLNNKENFIKFLKKNANITNPNMYTGQCLEYGYGLKPNGKFGHGLILKQHYEPKYEPSSVVGIIQNKIYTNPKENKFFIPVNYYGKRNPKAYPFSKRNP